MSRETIDVLVEPQEWIDSLLQKYSISADIDVAIQNMGLRIAQLEAHLAAKTKELDLMRILHSSECDRNAWLKVEFTAAQKNEDRYRWLLDNGNITVREIFGYDSPHLNSGLEIAIDAAIDAAKGK